VGRRGVRAGLFIQLVLGATAVSAVCAEARPVSGPHGTIEQLNSTTRPNAPTGFTFTGRYHAAGNPHAYPPYMRRMTFYQPRGMRYDTSVPERCTATDIELAAFGASRCPPRSRLGGGQIEAALMGRFRSTLKMSMFNNTGEQLVVAESPLITTVVRGRFAPDQSSIEWNSPTCWPSTPAGCPFDNALQLGATQRVAPYTRRIRGALRSYLTTPSRCPAARYWKTPVRLWWADGSQDTLVTKQPCTRPRASRKAN
jgi:hypothetical protein